MHQGSQQIGSAPASAGADRLSPPPSWLQGYLLCVDEHMLLEILPAHKQFITVITLEILLTRVDDHV